MGKISKGKGALLMIAVIALSAMWMTWAYAAPSLTNLSVSKSSLKATGSRSSTIRYTLSETARTNISILDSSGTAVRSLQDATVTAGSRSKAWNGKNDSSTLVDEATYTVQIVATSGSGTTTDTSLSIFVDRNDPVISNLSVSTSTVETSATTLDVSYTLSEACSAVTVRIYRYQGGRARYLTEYLDRSVAKGSGTQTASWDLLDRRDNLAPDGSYCVKVDARDASGRQATQVTTNFVMDLSDPTISCTSISKSVFSPNGRNSTSFRYTLTEYASVSIIAYDASDTAVGTILSDTTKTALSTASRARRYSARWKARVTPTESTPTVDDGTYTVVFTATDTAGNVDTDTATIVIDKTAPACTIGALGSLTTGSNQYLEIPLTFSENAYQVTVYILDSDGRKRKTLCRRVPMAAAGATLIWDGKRNSRNYWDAGTYTVKVWTKDEAKNAEYKTSNFTIN